MQDPETFWTLLTNLPHWEFELFLIALFDGLIGLLIWPALRRFLRHHESDDTTLEDLKRRVEELEKNRG